VAIWCPDDYEDYVGGLLGGIDRLSPDYGAVERFTNAWSQELELDAAGRVMVPSKMLAKAGLGKEVAVIGAGNRLEIWDREVWGRISDEIVSNVQQIGPGSSSGHTA
jgi:MraZ protein